MMLSIIIPTYNRNEVFYKSLAYLYTAVKGINSEIIVINDSQTNQIAIPNTFQDRVQLYSNPKSGVASARNYGFALSKGDLVLFMDDDINVNNENLLAAISIFEENRTNEHICLNLNWVYPNELLKIARVTKFGRFLEKYGFTSLYGWMNGEDWKDDTLLLTGYFSSYFLMMHRLTFEKIGGYNEKIPFGFEDHEFSFRAGQINEIQIFLDTSNTLYHNEFDRLDLKNWLSRKCSEAYGRATGFDISTGKNEQRIIYSKWKFYRYKMLLFVKPIIMFVFSIIPNHHFFDLLSFFLLKVLLGVSMFEGYKISRLEHSNRNNCS